MISRDGPLLIIYKLMVSWDGHPKLMIARGGPPYTMSWCLAVLGYMYSKSKKSPSGCSLELGIFSHLFFYHLLIYVTKNHQYHTWFQPQTSQEGNKCTNTLEKLQTYIRIWPSKICSKSLELFLAHFLTVCWYDSGSDKVCLIGHQYHGLIAKDVFRFEVD